MFATMSKDYRFPYRNILMCAIRFGFIITKFVQLILPTLLPRNYK